MEEEFAHHVLRIDSLILDYPVEGLSYHRASFPNMDHFSTVAPAITDAFVRLKNEHMLSHDNILAFAEKEAPLSQQMQQFVAEKQKAKAFLYEPAAGYYTYLANNLFDEERIEDALAVFQWADSKGGLLNWWEVLNAGHCVCELEGKLAAKAYFDRVMPLLQNAKEEYGDDFEDIKEDVTRQIETCIR